MAHAVHCMMTAAGVNLLRDDRQPPASYDLPTHLHIGRPCRHRGTFYVDRVFFTDKEVYRGSLQVCLRCASLPNTSQMLACTRASQLARSI